tara:strand:+ start:62525 stop:62638 length:114 start_codon:yes stop_codon:yes gene_type:complete
MKAALKRFLKRNARAINDCGFLIALFIGSQTACFWIG